MPTYANRPATGEYGQFYAPYIALVPEGDIADILESQIKTVAAKLRALQPERGTFRYQPGKWSINDIVNHLSDTERVQSYRLLRIARGDKTPLPGFEENDYAAAAGADGRDLSELVDELEAVRKSTLALVRSLDPEVWTRRGSANGYDVTAQALAYIIAGHQMHHMNVLRERYGVA